MAQMGASFNCWTWLGGLSIKLDESKNNKTHEALMNEIRDMKKYIKSEIEEIRRPEAGDASQVTFRKRHSIASSSHLEINRENNPLVQSSANDAAEQFLNNVNIFKVNRKTSLGRYFNPNSIVIKKKYK